MPDNYEQARLDNAAALEAMGQKNYEMPSWTGKLDSVGYARGQQAGQRSTTAGRVMLMRSFGKLIFLTVSDGWESVQFGLDAKRMEEAQFSIGQHIDLGDYVVADGEMGTTKKGEITLWATRVAVCCKALTPPPDKVDGLKDPELRLRLRHVDMWANPDVRLALACRSEVLTAIRNYLENSGFTEVETPILQMTPGGANARPFVTHYNALGSNVVLRIAPELYLKRCVIGGMQRVFEIGKNFRNEGVDRRHNPEFTAIEAYQAFAGFEDMERLIESMVQCTVQQVEHLFETVPPPKAFRRVDFSTLLAGNTTPGLESLTPKQMVDFYEEHIEPQLIEPTFVRHMPAEFYPLAKTGPVGIGGVQMAEMFEFVMGGREVGCGYTEQNDPVVQVEAFRRQRRAMLNDDDASAPPEVDGDFIDALKVGMPPTGGFGIGIDRLLMALLRKDSIRDVILFPQFRPV